MCEIELYLHTESAQSSDAHLYYAHAAKGRKGIGKEGKTGGHGRLGLCPGPEIKSIHARVPRTICIPRYNWISYTVRARWPPLPICVPPASQINLSNVAVRTVLVIMVQFSSLYSGFVTHGRSVIFSSGPRSYNINNNVCTWLAIPAET